MRIEKMSLEILQNEIHKSKVFITDCQKALDCIPESSMLGRLGVTMSIKKEKARLQKLEVELSKRV